MIDMNESQMNISNAVYQVYNDRKVGVSATIDGKNMSVPLSLANRHYAEIMRQVEAGTLTIQDAE